MEFNLPTTKEEMITILKDIFNHYRSRKEGFQAIELEPLSLARIDYQMPSETEIYEKALRYKAGEREREKNEYKEKLKTEIAKLNGKIERVDLDLSISLEKTRLAYDQAIGNVRIQATRNGLISSGVLDNKLAEMELEKANKISALVEKSNAEKTEYTSSLTAYTEALKTADDYLTTAHDKDVEEICEKLRLDYERTNREVAKYNNAQEEKELRYINSIKQINASLRVRYLEIKVTDYTTDELTEMGYYKDVIRCVCGYYDTLEAGAAYRDFNTNQDLPVYLDYYYQNILYMYAARAGY